MSVCYWSESQLVYITSCGRKLYNDEFNSFGVHGHSRKHPMSGVKSSVKMSINLIIMMISYILQPFQQYKDIIML